MNLTDSTEEAAAPFGLKLHDDAQRLRSLTDVELAHVAGGSEYCDEGQIPTVRSTPDSDGGLDCATPVTYGPD